MNGRPSPWLYNAAEGATMAPLLYHAVSNVVRELVPDVSNAAEVGVEAALALTITALAWRWMSRRRMSGTSGIHAIEGGRM